MADPLNRFERLSEGRNLATALGRSGLASRFQERLGRFSEKNPTLDTSGVDVASYGDWESLGPGGGLGRSAIMQDIRRRARGAEDPARFVNHAGIKLNKDIEGQMKQGLIDEIDPSLEQAQGRADALAGTDAISAGDEQAIAGRLVSAIRTGESQRFARTGQALGYGNAVMTGPATQALAADAAADADRLVTSTIRDLRLQTNETNRQQARMDIDLAARIAAARYALKNGNAKSLIEMQGELAETLDALYSRDWSMDMAEKQIEEAGKESFADRLGQWSSIGRGLASTAVGAYQGFGGGAAAAATPPTGGMAGPATMMAMGRYR